MYRAPPQQYNSDIRSNLDDGPDITGDTFSVLTLAEIERYLMLLTNHQSAEQRARGITQIKASLSTSPAVRARVEASFALTKKLMGDFFIGLRSNEPELVEATISLLLCVIRGSGESQEDRMVYLIENKAYERILRIAEGGVFPSQKPLPQRAAVAFLAQALVVSPSLRGSFFQGRAGELCRTLAQSSNGDFSLLVPALRCYRNLSLWPEMRPSLAQDTLLDRITEFLEIGATGLKPEWTDAVQDDPSLLTHYYETLVSLVRNLAAHEEKVKKTFLNQNVFANLLWVLESTQPIQVKQKTCYALGNILVPNETGEWSELGVEACEHLAELFLGSQNSQPTQEASLCGFRNILFRIGTAAHVRAYEIGVLEPFIEALSIRNLKIVEHAAVCLRNMALIDKSRNTIANAMPVLIRVLKREGYFAGGDIGDVVHHILCIICNLSVDDVLSQSLYRRNPELLPTLYQILHGAQDPDLKSDALSCLRNLCIDEESCLKILALGNPKLMDLLLTGEANLRRGCMSILRNLVLQNLQCFNEFFKTEGFVSEIIADVASRDLNLQRFAIEIVKGYLDTGTDSILQAFYEADSMPALLVPLETANSNREIAGICFKILQKFESKIHAGKNPWVRVWAEWKAQDDQRRAELREKRKAARELKKQRREEKQAAEGKDSSGGKSPKRKPKGGGPSKGNLKSKSSAKPKKSTPKKGPKPKAPPTTTPRSPKSRSD